MAKDKKSILFYVDWGNTFDELPDEVAGKLIKHLCDYVRDKNPKTDDFMINGLFANFKATLKRDLDKWVAKSEKNSANAKKRWNKEKSENMRTHTNAPKRNAKNADKVTVTDTDTVNVISLKEKIENYLLSANTWQISVIRNLKAKGIKKDVSIDSLKKWIKDFCTELEATEDVYKTERESKSHFTRWVTIQMAKEEKSSNNTKKQTRHESTLDHNRGTAEALGIN